MKKYLLLAVMMLSFNASARDVENMTKEEVKTVGIELYEALKANVTQDTCKAFFEFRKESGKFQKLDMLDFSEQDRFSFSWDECNGIGYKK